MSLTATPATGSFPTNSPMIDVGSALLARNYDALAAYLAAGGDPNVPIQMNGDEMPLVLAAARQLRSDGQAVANRHQEILSGQRGSNSADALKRNFVQSRHIIAALIGVDGKSPPSIKVSWENRHEGQLIGSKVLLDVVDAFNFYDGDLTPDVKNKLIQEVRSAIFPQKTSANPHILGERSAQR